MVERKSNDLLKSRFRTGRCNLCARSGCRLEAHHIRYRPEVVIDLCHGCHFKVHFQKQRLNEGELYKLLCRVYRPETMQKYQGRLRELLNLSHSHSHSHVKGGGEGIAPSRKEYLETVSALDTFKKASQKQQKS